MIRPRTLLRCAIDPALSLLPERMGGDEARAMLVSIALQECDLRARRQIGGPARGLWQFETGGVRGVLDHPASDDHAQAICEALLLPTEYGGDGLATSDAVIHLQRIIEHADVAAAAFARLALWRLPAPLADSDDPDAGWAQYIDAWGPGKPKPDKWAACWATAWSAVTETV